jgi:transcriptional regulator of heat shock response
MKETEHTKLSTLLDVVIEHYIDKWDPIGSKFLHTVEWVEYAPSTLRKYLHQLEQEWLVYQAYNSSGRIPTIDGMKAYVTSMIETSQLPVPVTTYDFEVNTTRTGLRYLVETLSTYVDGVVTGFIRNDEYYFLGINKLLKWEILTEWELVKYIIEFIESQRVVSVISSQMMKNSQIYHTFVQEDDKVISIMYTKIVVNDYEAILSIIWPMRSNYKQNLDVLKQFVDSYRIKNQPK